MVIYLVAARYQNLVQRHARCLAPSTSVDLLLVDRYADCDLGVQNLDWLISICSWFYHRMAFPAFVILRLLEPQAAPALVCPGSHKESACAREPGGLRDC